MEAIIRRAVKEDCAQMLELVKELALYEKAPEQVTVSLNHFEESGFGEMPVWWAFVVESKSNIIGMALYYIRYSTWKGQRMYLEDIVISESFRGKGYGTLLINALVQEAKEKHFSGMMWQVLDWNEPALNFYRKYNAEFDSEWINVSLNF